MLLYITITIPWLVSPVCFKAKHCRRHGKYQTTIISIEIFGGAKNIYSYILSYKYRRLDRTEFGSVRKGIPTDASVIVACQKGLRSLSACEQLAKNGYSKVAWVTGGLDTAEPGDLPVVGNKDIRFAGNGGVSDLVGWTEAHRKANKEQSVFDGPFGIVLKVALGILALDFASFVFDQISQRT